MSTGFGTPMAGYLCDPNPNHATAIYTKRNGAKEHAIRSRPALIGRDFQIMRVVVWREKKRSETERTDMAGIKSEE
jgi:hypothetical protein